VPAPGSGTAHAPLRHRLGLVAGPAVFALLLLLPAPAGLAPAGWRTTALGLLMAVWWITEAIPLAATALLPLVLTPLLGIGSIQDAAHPYANPVIFLFLGGFLIAAAVEHCGLHRRLALSVLGVVGSRPSRLLAGFMLATALISMWVSNTATVMMMLPMALSITALVARDGAGSDAARSGFSTALLLGVAYAASIGGLGTLIGTPPNALLAGFMSQQYGTTIGFAEWMLVGVPLVTVALPICWFLLARVLYRVDALDTAGGTAFLAQARSVLGPLSRTEVVVGGVTALTALAWMTRPLLGRVIHGLSDTGIAIGGALLLFVIPVSWREGRFPLTWREAARVPWSILLLFGGGLSLAEAIQGSGLADWIGDRLAVVGSAPLPVTVAVITLLIVFLTEITSNTATAATFIPIVASLADGLGIAPMLLVVPAALSASCAFMLPVATPPNAIVYGSERLSAGAMARAGLGLNLVMTALIVLVTLLLVPAVGLGGGG